MYGNRKREPIYYDIGTQAKAEAGYLALFRELDNDWGVYNDLLETFEPPQKCKPCSHDLHEHCEGSSKSPVCHCQDSPECVKRTKRIQAERAEIHHQRHLYDRAKAGDGKAAIRLLRMRNGNEYEEIRETILYDPLSDTAS
jgi:hypothetical protein